MHLALRNLNDAQAADPRPTTVADLRLSQDKARAEAPPAPPEPVRPLRIRTPRGNQEGAILVVPSPPGARRPLSGMTQKRGERRLPCTPLSLAITSR
jgi:hypothetical protein